MVVVEAESTPVYSDEMIRHRFPYPSSQRHVVDERQTNSRGEI